MKHLQFFRTKMAKPSPVLSVVVSTYERPSHLHRCLASLRNQTIDARTFEIIVADDGSKDQTPAVVDAFRRSTASRVVFTTQTNHGFRKARAVNLALREVKAAYVVLTDGDCIFPPDHLEQHLCARKPGVVRSGNSVFLDQVTSESIRLDLVESGNWLERVPRRLPASLIRSYRKAKLYQAVGHRTKPRLVGNNIGVWRDQLDRINGFDQAFEGWGCEDDDLGFRLRMQGSTVRTLLGYTHAYHLWHPVHATKASKWKDGANVARLHRPLVLSRCVNGISNRSLRSIGASIHAEPSSLELAAKIRSYFPACDQDARELEIRFWPTAARFSEKAECNLLVGSDFLGVPKKLRRQVGLYVQIEEAASGVNQTARQIVHAIQEGLGMDTSLGEGKKLIAGRVRVPSRLYHRREAAIST